MPIVPDGTGVSVFSVVPVYKITDGLKLLPHVSNWYTPPCGTLHAYHTEAPPGPGSPVSVVAFTFVPVRLAEPPETSCALAKLSLAGASDALGVIVLDTGEAWLSPTALVATAVNV